MIVILKEYRIRNALGIWSTHLRRLCFYDTDDVNIDERSTCAFCADSPHLKPFENEWFQSKQQKIHMK